MKININKMELRNDNKMKNYKKTTTTMKIENRQILPYVPQEKNQNNSMLDESSITWDTVIKNQINPPHFRIETEIIQE